MHRPAQFGWVRLKMKFCVQVHFDEHVLCRIGQLHFARRVRDQIVKRSDELGLAYRPLEVLPS